MADQPADNEEKVPPYCGGCGHRFFGEPQISAIEAIEQAARRRCHYCYEDEKEDDKKRRSPR